MRTKKLKKVRKVSAEKLLSSTENMAKINELRRLCYPSPTGKAGRPPLQMNYAGMP